MPTLATSLDLPIGGKGLPPYGLPIGHHPHADARVCALCSFLSDIAASPTTRLVCGCRETGGASRDRVSRVARRLLEQQSGQRARGLPQRESPEQPEQQHRFSGVVRVPHPPSALRVPTCPADQGLPDAGERRWMARARPVRTSSTASGAYRNEAPPGLMPHGASPPLAGSLSYPASVGCGEVRTASVASFSTVNRLFRISRPIGRIQAAPYICVEARMRPFPDALYPAMLAAAGLYCPPVGGFRGVRQGSR